LALGAVIACAYFMAARLGLALLSEDEDVAVFWPASGVAAGTLILLGARARACVAAGVVTATVAANVLGDRGLLASLAFGLCNAGEALLAAWLVDRWCGPRFKFDDLRGLWGFLAAATLAAMAAAAVAAIAMDRLHTAASVPTVWRVWAAADGLGIVTIAPLLVGLYHLAHDPPRRNEILEGTGALALLAATSAAVYAAPTTSWLSQVPSALLFPILFWIGARCRPGFAAGAAFILAAALVGSVTFRLGVFADAPIPIFSVQVTMLVGALCALSLAALFAERRRSEAALLESNERLRLALGGAQLGVWSADLTTGAFESDARDSCINGHNAAAPPRTLAEVRKFVHPDDLARLDMAFGAARRTGTTCQAEYRVLAPGNADCTQARWAAVEGTVVRDAAGQAIRLLGVTRDITERKHAEAQKDLLLAELDHRVKNALAVVTALVSRTREASSSLTEFVAALDGRIKSMSTTHELLSGRRWQGLPLCELIERELEPYATGSNVRIEGPGVVLSAETGQALAMVVHELVTNAAKYGALSVQRGHVAVSWRLRAENGAGAALVLDWAETDGPAVAVSARTGYGTSVIRDLVPYELGGTVDLELAPEGVRCRLEIPAKWLRAIDPPDPAARAAPGRQVPDPADLTP
jgi:two-component sensor histidine kinase/integral membrane sensor domain MASE1